MSTSTGRRSRPTYEGSPSLVQVMRTPKWIGALLLSLLVAGGFAFLGQWQLGHAITLNQEDSSQSEQVRPLSAATTPSSPVTDETAGHVFSVVGEFARGDFSLVLDRRNDGVDGVWVVGHLGRIAPSGGNLAVAIAWAPTVAKAERAKVAFEAALSNRIVSIEGRYMPPDAPVVPTPKQDPTLILSMAPSQLVNLWQATDGGTYGGFLVLHPGSDISKGDLSAVGVTPIQSVPPLPVETINWLNLFYAAEWVVFAGFAIFFWFRLVRDDWEKIHELKLLAEAEAQQTEE